MQEALNEWIVLDNENLKFHKGQYQEPYRSTVKFFEFLREKINGHNRNKILDLGCGAGAVLDYLLTEGHD